MEHSAATPSSAVDIAKAKLHELDDLNVAPSLRLPIQIITKADISRISREVEELQTFFDEAAVKGASTKSVPQVSQQLTALMNENNLNILHLSDRKALVDFISLVRKKAPVVHASFAADPKPDFLMYIVKWFRTEAHPYVLLQIGLQPGIAAGCVYRTTNKYFDFSFKKHFEDSKTRLGASLRIPT